MPKRKSNDDYEYLNKKLRKLQRKIRRKTRCLSSSSSDDSTPVTKDKEEESIPLEEDLQMDVIDIECSDTTADALQQLAETNSGSTQPEPSTSTADNSKEASTSAEPILELDQDIMEILGSDPTLNVKYGKDINADLAVRLQHYSTSGITKEMRKEFCEKYRTPNNCKLIDAPQLNAEIKAALSDIVSKRDKYIENRQKQIATTLSCLSEALSHLFSAQNKDTYLIRLIMDACRNLADCQHNDSITRRNFILSTVKKDMKEQLQNTKLTDFLFGDNLSETIKVAKAINKSGAELKATLPPQKPVQNKKPAPGSKNWKTPFPAKKPPSTGVQKTREPAPPPPPPRSRPSSSYKQSQPRQNNTRR